MQRSVAFLGLVASVSLLLVVFLFALTNSELFFIDDTIKTDLTVSGSSEPVLVEAKISGEVVDSQAVQIRESAKFHDSELEALKNEQWLQQIDPSVVNDSITDAELDFAPEISTASLQAFQSSAKDNQGNSTSVEEMLQALNKMKFTAIRFQFGQLKLSDKALLKIEMVANIMKNNLNIIAKINNYTDSFGDDDFNLELSRQRASMIYQAFLDKGVDKRQLSFEGLGESNPITSNATLAGRKKNRRTEILFSEVN